MVESPREDTLFMIMCRYELLKEKANDMLSKNSGRINSSRRLQNDLIDSKQSNFMSENRPIIFHFHPVITSSLLRE
jgi:hypothetical protein